MFSMLFSYFPSKTQPGVLILALPSPQAALSLIDASFFCCLFRGWQRFMGTGREIQKASRASRAERAQGAGATKCWESSPSLRSLRCPQVCPYHNSRSVCKEKERRFCPLQQCFAAVAGGWILSRLDGSYSLVAHSAAVSILASPNSLVCPFRAQCLFSFSALDWLIG